MSGLSGNDHSEGDLSGHGYATVETTCPIAEVPSGLESIEPSSIVKAGEMEKRIQMGWVL